MWGVYFLKVEQSMHTHKFTQNKPTLLNSEVVFRTFPFNVEVSARATEGKPNPCVQQVCTPEPTAFRTAVYRGVVLFSIQPVPFPNRLISLKGKQPQGHDQVKQ